MTSPTDETTETKGEKAPTGLWATHPALLRWICRVGIVAFALIALASGVLWGASSSGVGVVFLVLSAVGVVVNGILAAQLAKHTQKTGFTTAVVVGYAVLALGAFTDGHQTWLAVTGNAPQQCTYVDAGATVQCGSDLLQYEAKAGSGDYVTLVTDSTGLTKPLQPNEVTDWLNGDVIRTAVVYSLLVIVFLVRARRPKAQPTERTQPTESTAVDF